MANIQDQLKELYAKIAKWVEVYQANGGRKSLPSEAVAYFEQIKNTLLPLTQKAMKVQGAVTPQREQGGGKQATIPSIKKGVGKKGDNDSEDVKRVQELLTKRGYNTPMTGEADSTTVDNIAKFQKEVLGTRNPDATVDPGGSTWFALLTGKKVNHQEKVMLRVEQYDSTIDKAAEQYGMKPEHLKAIMAVESNGDPVATSGAAYGLMQITSGTWKDIQKRYPDLKQYDFTEENWKNPEINILFGAAVLKDKAKQMGVSTDHPNFVMMAVTAYNAGATVVKRAIEHAKDAGSKDPEGECFQEEHLTYAIGTTTIWHYYYKNETGRKRNKYIGEDGNPTDEAKAKTEAIYLKYKEVSGYGPKMKEYLAVGEDVREDLKEIGIDTTGDNSGEQPKTDTPKEPRKEQTYVVQNGDKIEAISAKFNVSVDALKAANKDKLQEWKTRNGVIEGFNAGETITIPAADGGSSTGGTDEPSIIDQAVDVAEDLYEKGKEVVEDVLDKGKEVVDSVVGGIKDLIWGSDDDKKEEPKQETPKKEPRKEQTYVVQNGDKIEAISAKFNVSVDALKAANKDKLQEWKTRNGVIEGFNAGETITIPAADGGSSTGGTDDSPTSTPTDDQPTDGGGYFTHPKANEVKLTMSSNAIALNSKAEALLKSLLAASDNFAATVTSTYRTLYHQARVMNKYYPTQKGLVDLYGSKAGPVADAREKVKAKGGSTEDVIQAMAKAIKDSGVLFSKHMSNKAIDISPSSFANRKKFYQVMDREIAVSGSGAAKLLEFQERGEKAVHIEFTFNVTG